MKRYFLFLSIVLAIGNVVRGQILHTEDFNLILDTTKAIKGNLIPSRMASSSQLIYNINQHIGFSILYQNIYDPDPQVPIDELFHDISLGLTLSF